MPVMGKLVQYSVMTDRYVKAKKASAMIHSAIEREAGDAVAEARRIPVSTETDRVMISQDVNDRIAMRRCKQDIRYFVSNNKLDIQRALLYRKHGLDMM